MKYSNVTLGVLLALGTQLPVQAADLVDVYHAAQSQDAVFASARAARQEGEEKLTQGRSLLLPSVTFNANTTSNDVTIDYGAASPIFVSGGMRYNTHGVNLVERRCWRTERVEWRIQAGNTRLGRYSEVGVRTNPDVLNAQQQLFSTKRDLYQAQYSYLVSQLRLKAAVGNLAEADLISVNQSLH